MKPQHRSWLFVLGVLLTAFCLAVLMQGAIGTQSAQAFGMSPHGRPGPLDPVVLLGATTTPDADAQGSGSVTLSWVPSYGADSYNIYCDEELVDEVDQPEEGSVVTWQADGLSAGSYDYYVESSVGGHAIRQEDNPGGFVTAEVGDSSEDTSPAALDGLVAIVGVPMRRA